MICQLRLSKVQEMSKISMHVSIMEKKNTSVHAGYKNITLPEGNTNPPLASDVRYQ